jgi:hypothetical protein
MTSVRKAQGMAAARIGRARRVSTPTHRAPGCLNRRPENAGSKIQSDRREVVAISQ